MGAYLHLRGLIEVDDISDFNLHSERIRYLSEGGSGTVDASSIPGRFPSGSEGNSPSTSDHMSNCSNFWAGQDDEIVEDLQTKTWYDASRRGRIGCCFQDDTILTRGRWFDGGQKGNSGSGERGSVENARIGQIVDNKTLEDAVSMQLGHVTGDFNHRLVSNTESMVCYIRCRGAAVAASGNPCVVMLSEGVRGSACCHEDISVDSGEGGLRSRHNRRGSCEVLEDETERLPDHLLIELLVRVPTRDWPATACVKKRWAQLFRGDGLWQSALMRKWPSATLTKRWPGPIARGSSKRRYTALYVSDSLFARDKVEGVNEVAGHVYLFLKEQLESSTPPVSYGLLHGTIIDQFLACCKTGDEAHDLASHIWVAVLDNLVDSESTFHLLMRIAEEWEVFLPYPYSKSHAVQWRLFERLFTDFRDCLSQYNYLDILTRARSKFELIPQTWLGY